MRQIVIDTETTGLELADGHRILEIGCVELVNRKLTQKTFHRYLNPQREIEAEALAVHGITQEFLQDKPRFSEILTEFLTFLGEEPIDLIAHNANFDLSFINQELKLAASDHPPLETQFKIVDTLEIARKKFPGQRNTLDAICRRYKLSLEERKAKGHGALLDAELLAQAYLLMTGGQISLFADWVEEGNRGQSEAGVALQYGAPTRRESPIHYAQEEELQEHQRLLKLIKKQSNRSIWEEYDE